MASTTRTQRVKIQCYLVQQLYILWSEIVCLYKCAESISSDVVHTCGKPIWSFDMTEQENGHCVNVAADTVH